MTFFSEFSETCDLIENTPGSLEMTDIVSKFLKKLDADEIAPVCYMLTGVVFPRWTEKELGIGPSTYYAALSAVSGKSDDDIRNLLKESGDVGEVTVKAFSEGRRKQATLFGFISPAEPANDPRPSGAVTLSDFGTGSASSSSSSSSSSAVTSASSSAAPSGTLTIKDVYERLERLASSSGRDAQTKRIRILETLLSDARPAEAKYIARLVLQEMRIGVGEAIVRDAVSKAFGIPQDVVEFAIMVTDDVGFVAGSAQKGEDAVRSADIRPGRPVKMMLAQVTPSVESAFSDLGRVAVEWKFDGARLQIHKTGETVRLYSRRLENVTSSLPDIADAVRRCVRAETAILDGEAVAVDENGRPRAFQEILRRFRRKYDVASTAETIPLRLNLFDLMYLDGKSLIRSPLEERRKYLSEIVSSDPLIVVDSFTVTENPEDAYRIYEEALAAGHEGVMLKNPASFYSPGKRGKNWMKKKPLMDTLDLVVIGGEWGIGKRRNRIGSFTMACAAADGESLIEIGRVGTGISDELLDQLTEKLEDLIISEDGTNISIHPEIVFEVAFEEIQKSPNTEAGYSLRFPRLVRVREDKSVEDIDTAEKVEKMYFSQAGI